MRQLALVGLLLAALAGCTTTSTSPSGGSAGEVRTKPSPADIERGARMRLELASAYFGRGQIETALDEVNQALTAKPDYAEALNLRGLIYARMGEDALADESFRRALQVNPRDADTMHNYGWFLCQQKRFADATAQFAQALVQPNYRDTTRTVMAQGICEARAGRWVEAERLLLRAYELDAANPAIAVNLSEVLYRRGEYERARFYVRRVNQRAELSNAQTLWLAARIENRLGNRGQVEEFGRQLRGRFPQAPETAAFERGRFDD